MNSAHIIRKHAECILRLFVLNRKLNKLMSQYDKFAFINRVIGAGASALP